MFTYDHLNRLTSFHKIINPVESYSIDPWGNMQRQPMGTNPLVFPTSNRLPGMTCTQIGGSSAFDGAGNQLCDGNPAFTGTVHEYTYNPDNQITNITDGSGNPIATYTLNGDGGRVRKDLPDGSWKEYMAAGGEVMSELDQNGNWTDYIYAAGQKIAKVENFDVRLHIAGLCPATTSSCYTGWNIPAPSSYTVRNGDKLMWRQYESSGYGGFDVVFSNGVQTWQSWYDLQGDGEVMGLGVQSQWTFLSADLSPYAGTSMLAFTLMVGTYPGPFDMMFGDIAIVSADGVVTPIYNRQLGITPSLSANYGSATNLTAVSEQVLNSANPLTTDAATSTSYYVADHLGTTQMEFGGGGWPIWRGDFDPWGQERDTNTTAMNYKFTGKERDAETGVGGQNGLDYFGARYLANGSARFMSPDMMVDQHPELPQSMNLYSYVRNNPLNSTDPTGHFDCDIKTVVCGQSIVAALQLREAADDTSNPNMFALRGVSDALGTYGDHNGVIIQAGDLGGRNAEGFYTEAQTEKNGKGLHEGGSTITINTHLGLPMGYHLADLLAHEGTHVMQNQQIANIFSELPPPPSKNIFSLFSSPDTTTHADIFRDEFPAWYNESLLSAYFNWKETGTAIDPALVTQRAFDGATKEADQTCKQIGCSK